MSNTHDEPRNFIKITSPEGILEYPQSLQKPNTKFDTNGIWQCNLILPAEEGLAFKEEIEKLFENEIVDAVKSYANLKKKPKLKPLAIEENEDGTLTFKLKMKTTLGKKKIRPIIVGEDGQPVDAQLATGTKAKVGIVLYGWHSASMGIGVTMQPRAVSISEVVEYQAESGFDFNIDSSAYKDDEAEPVTDDPEDQEELDDEDEDF